MCNWLTPDGQWQPVMQKQSLDACKQQALALMMEKKIKDQESERGGATLAGERKNGWLRDDARKQGSIGHLFTLLNRPVYVCLTSDILWLGEL